MPLDTLLDLHSKLSTVVRYYDRMLEERLSSAYSQQSLGYGSIPGATQYPAMPGVPSAPDIKPGAENYYYTNAPDTPRASAYTPHQVSSTGYETSHSGAMNSPYSQQVQNNWGQTPYPSLGSPPLQSNAIPNNQFASGPAGAPQYYAPQPEQNPSQAQPPYHPSPVMRRDSQYQASAPEAHSPEQVPSPAYSSMPPVGPAVHQQQTGAPPPQSYYYQPQQSSTVPSGYPPMAADQPGAYPDATQAPAPGSHQPPQPVEESLIEL